MSHTWNIAIFKTIWHEWNVPRVIKRILCLSASVIWDHWIWRKTYLQDVYNCTWIILLRIDTIPTQILVWIEYKCHNWYYNLQSRIWMFQFFCDPWHCVFNSQVWFEFFLIIQSADNCPSSLHQTIWWSWFVLPSADIRTWIFLWHHQDQIVMLCLALWHINSPGPPHRNEENLRDSLPNGCNCCRVI